MPTSTSKGSVHARALAALNKLTDEEDAALVAAARNDPDNPPLTDEELASLRPSRGRPRSPKKKVPVTLRIDPDVLASYKNGGSGWQTEMNKTLKRHAPKGTKAA